MNTSSVVFGVIIVIVGVLFLLNSTGFADLSSVFQWWPMLIVLFGVWRLVAHKFRRLFMPLLLIAIGVILQLTQLDIGVDFGDLWPVILILIGIAVLAGGLRRRRWRRTQTVHGASSPSVIDVGVTSDTDDGAMNAVFSSESKRVSGDFQEGQATVVMGSGNLDMRNAHITEKPATLEITVVMGELKLRVPAEWNVQTTNTTVMGETKDIRGSREADSDTPEFVISGTVVMGSLQIDD